MSAPFQPGDVVSCVDDSAPSWHEPKNHALALGDVFTVLYFVRGLPFGWGFPRSFVVFRGREKALLHWDAYRFRKIDDEVTEDFRETLRKLPVKTPEPVA